MERTRRQRLLGVLALVLLFAAYLAWSERPQIVLHYAQQGSAVVHYSFLENDEERLAGVGTVGALAERLVAAHPAIEPVLPVCSLLVGGRASTGVRPVLDVQPESLHQRVGFVFGSKEEVERIERYHHEPLIGGEQDELPLFHARSLFRDTEFTQ